MDKYLLGLKIKENRKRVGLNQLELGKMIGKTNGAIKAYENGRAEPSLNTLEKLAAIFNITLFDLLDVDNNYQDNRTFERYKALNPMLKYVIESLINSEFLKEAQTEYKITETDSQLTPAQQEELEELRQAMIKENQAKSLQSMEKKKIEKNIG